ncbi:MAG: hypothetical protein R2860_11680 [Desulfobacterales bacterium]
MWQKQVGIGCVPYYMFVAGDTGSHQFFAVIPENAWKIFRSAYQKVSGLARTQFGAQHVPPIQGRFRSWG